MSHPLNKTGILLGWEKKGDACHKLFECGFYMHYFFLVSSNWVNAGNLFRNFYYPKKTEHTVFIALFITVLFILHRPLSI